MQFEIFKKAPVAQGIERQPPELKAAGSNPAGRTRKQKRVSGRYPFFIVLPNWGALPPASPTVISAPIALFLYNKIFKE
jgi:hypothetical protein